MTSVLNFLFFSTGVYRQKIFCLHGHSYDPFGSLEKQRTKTDNDKLFTGKETDFETGLQYFGARYYDPVVGRWVSRDPVKAMFNYPMSQNRYLYCFNNPLRYTDPLGLWINNGDGSFTAEKDDTLSGLQKETGRDWKDTGFNRDPKSLQIGETVTYAPDAPANNTTDSTVDSTEEAVDHYYHGQGANVNIGPNSISQLQNHPDQQAGLDKLRQGKSKNQYFGGYGIDMTTRVYHIGDTGVRYKVAYGEKYGLITFTAFLHKIF
ncbi:MAG TPA: RHS repeat-associated core domain-containing protein, partial [Spirochaetota bacterium]|nr:RHS repeat-associated core domain-containing protein [Spirochaetota bacterium]